MIQKTNQENMKPRPSRIINSVRTINLFVYILLLLLLLSFTSATYTLDQNGCIGHSEESGTITNYEYWLPGDDCRIKTVTVNPGTNTQQIFKYYENSLIKEALYSSAFSGDPRNRNYIYDDSGNLVEITAPDSREVFAYDAEDRIWRETAYTNDNIPITLDYEYDSQDRITKIMTASTMTYFTYNSPAPNEDLPSQETVYFAGGSKTQTINYSYNSKGNVINAKDNQGYDFSWSYNTIDYQCEIDGQPQTCQFEILKDQIFLGEDKTVLRDANNLPIGYTQEHIGLGDSENFMFDDQYNANGYWTSDAYATLTYENEIPKRLTSKNTEIPGLYSDFVWNPTTNLLDRVVYPQYSMSEEIPEVPTGIVGSAILSLKNLITGNAVSNQPANEVYQDYEEYFYDPLGRVIKVVYHLRNTEYIFYAAEPGNLDSLVTYEQLQNGYFPPLENCSDNDNDGYYGINPIHPTECGVSDCDDTNPNINRDAEEICDQIDNDCDNQIDEDYACGVPLPILYDSDNDTYYEVSNCLKLQNMKSNLSRNYELTEDVDCSATINWNNGAGFIPIGNLTSPFMGSFQGNGFSIKSLYMTSGNNKGLFGVVATSGIVSNFKMSNTSIAGVSYVGAVAGVNNGRISKATTSGIVTGTGGSIGGLVGENKGIIEDSYSTEIVYSLGGSIGGLVGRNAGNISRCYANAILLLGETGRRGIMAGGFVGGQTMFGATRDSFSTSIVIGGSSMVGSFFGHFEGVLSNSRYTPSNSLPCSANTNPSMRCNASIAPYSYFMAKSYTKSPMNTWDFSNIWQETSSYPAFKSREYTFFINNYGIKYFAFPIVPNSLNANNLFSSLPAGTNIGIWNTEINNWNIYSKGRSGWGNFSFNLKNGFYISNQLNNYPINATIQGSLFNAPLELMLYPGYNYISIPYCYQHYTASRVLQDLNSSGIYCSRIFAYNSLNGLWDKNYSLEAGGVNFVIGSGETYAVKCEIAQFATWTPNCNPAGILSLNQYTANSIVLSASSMSISNVNNRVSLNIPGSAEIIVQNSTSNAVENINVIVSNSPNVNFIIVQNASVSGEARKTISLNRRNSYSDAICFVDEEVGADFDFSDCTILRCPGSLGNYSCSLENNVFVLSGLSHSAVIESMSSCGDNFVAESEECDNDNFNGKTCASVLGNSYSGTLQCSDLCSIDSSGCSIGGNSGDDGSGGYSCFDNIQNQDETGIDCGGVCEACAQQQYLLYQENPDEKLQASSVYYINYTKPDGAASSSLWQVKHGTLNTYNITLPSECWNAYSNKLVLRMYSNSNDGNSNAALAKSHSRPHCYNGTSWINVGQESYQRYEWTLRGCVPNPDSMVDGDWNTFNSWIQYTFGGGQCWSNNAAASASMRWYEEAMWWNIINQTEFEEELVSNVINQIKSTDNEQKYRLVIGSTTVEDSIASIDLAGYLGIGETITDSEASTDENVIVIGGPAINSIAADLLNLDFPTEGLASGIPLNKGIIKVFKNNGKTQILVAGYNAIDTRIAAQAIVQYADQLTDTSIITSGKSLDDISITK